MANGLTRRLRRGKGSKETAAGQGEAAEADVPNDEDATDAFDAYEAAPDAKAGAKVAKARLAAGPEKAISVTW